MDQQQVLRSGVGVLAMAGLALLSASGCAFEGGTGAPVATQDPTMGVGAQTESVGRTQEGLSCPNCFPLPYLCNPDLTDTCCDPAKYSSCTVQSKGPTADVKVKLYQCLPGKSTKDTEGGVPCEVEPGWVVIGGGARVLDADYDDVTLWSSHPGDNGEVLSTKWYVAAVSRKGRPAFRLQQYAVAIKLKNYNLREESPVRVFYSGPNYHMENQVASVKVANGHLLLGAGFGFSKPGTVGWMYHGNEECDAQLVNNYVSLPGTGTLNGTVHTASIKAAACAGGIGAIAMSVPRCPPRWDGECLESLLVEDKSSTGTGERVAFPQHPSDGYLFTGMSFKSSPASRVVGEMFLVPQQLWVPGGSRITTYGSASGTVTGQAIYIRK